MVIHRRMVKEERMTSTNKSVHLIDLTTYLIDDCYPFSAIPLVAWWNFRFNCLLVSIKLMSIDRKILLSNSDGWQTDHQCPSRIWHSMDIQ